MGTHYMESVPDLHYDGERRKPFLINPHGYRYWRMSQVSVLREMTPENISALCRNILEDIKQLYSARIVYIPDITPLTVAKKDGDSSSFQHYIDTFRCQVDYLGP